MSCVQKRGGIEQADPLEKLSNRIAKKNNCNLISEVDSSETDKINITIDQSFVDLFFPGKILYDFHFEICSSELNFKEFRISGCDSSELYSFSAMELSKVARRSWHSKSVISKLVSNDFLIIYNELNSDFQELMSLEVFEMKMSQIDFESMSFSGFIVNEAYLIIGYSNSECRLLLTYAFEADENLLLEVSLE